eukprot:m.12810 g.12810  ORF g.12810 m.12810 type:complete len:59 (+) comp4062_c0_seq1:1269-1445(+)
MEPHQPAFSTKRTFPSTNPKPSYHLQPPSQASPISSISNFATARNKCLTYPHLEVILL